MALSQLLDWVIHYSDDVCYNKISICIITLFSIKEANVNPINLFDYEVLARKSLEPAIWDYYDGGSDDELTLAMALAGCPTLSSIDRSLILQ
jgi:hypothetical protein